MPLPIKTAAHNQDGHTVRAVLVTPSFGGVDVDNLVGQEVDTVLGVTHNPPPSDVRYVDVSFHLGRVEHVAATTVPGYLLWDGAKLCAVTPRVFAQEYTVVGREDPQPRPSTYHG